MNLKQRIPLSKAGKLLIAFVAALLCGCSGKKDNSGAVALQASQALCLYSWGEYFSPEVLQEFTDRTGIEVDYQPYTSADEMMEKLRSNPEKFDVVIVENAWIPKLANARLLKELDKSKINSLPNLDSAYLNFPFDPQNTLSVPYTWGTTLLAYRKDLLPDPNNSWDLLFDPKLANKISLLDERLETFAAMMRARGIDPARATPQDVKQAGEMLMTLITEQGAKLGSDNEMKEHLLTGASWVAQIYSGDAALIAEDDERIGFFIPAEGASLWLDNFVISRDSPHSEQAHMFINFMTEAETAAKTANFLRYASPNKAANSLIDPKLLADRTIYPDAEVARKCTFLLEPPTTVQVIMNKIWRVAKETSLARRATEETPQSKGALQGQPLPPLDVEKATTATPAPNEK